MVYSYTESILESGGKILRAKLMGEIDWGQSQLLKYLGIGRDEVVVLNDEGIKNIQEAKDFLKSMGNLVYITLEEIRNRIIKQVDITLETAQEMNTGKGEAYLKDRSNKFRIWDQSTKCVSPKYKDEFEELLYNVFKARVDVYQKIMNQETYEKANEKTYAELVKAAWPNKNDARKAFFKEFVYQKRMLNKINSKPEIMRDELYGMREVRKPMIGILNSVFKCAIIQLKYNLDEVYGSEVCISTPRQILTSNGVKAE